MIYLKLKKKRRGMQKEKKKKLAKRLHITIL